MPSHKLVHQVALVGVAANAAIKPIHGWLFQDGIAPNWLVLACLLMGLLLCAQDWRDEPLSSHRQWVLPVTLSAVCLVPVATLSWFALAALVIGMPTSRRAKFIVVLAALRIPFSSFVMGLFAGPMLSLDGYLAGAWSTLFGLEVTVIGNMMTNRDAHSIFIMTGCSSFANITDFLLVWATAALYLGKTGWRTMIAGSLCLILVVIGINVTRLSLMLVSVDSYLFYHNGHGVELVQITQALTVFVAISILMHTSSRAKA